LKTETTRIMAMWIQTRNC